MPQVNVPSHLGPMQIDDFGPKAKRSRKGALHIRPSSTLVLTDDELAFLKKEHKDVFKQLIVLPSQKAAAPVPAKKPAPVAVEISGTTDDDKPEEKTVEKEEEKPKEPIKKTVSKRKKAKL